MGERAMPINHPEPVLAARPGGSRPVRRAERTHATTSHLLHSNEVLEAVA
jgi:hypothetical protein